MAKEAKITKEMISAMQGVIPVTLATCSEEGIPNITYISQVFYVDDTHIALSCQFMNKTWHNLHHNPVASVFITCPATLHMWKLKLRYLKAQTEGPVYDQMDLQLAAIASLHGVQEGLFKIRAALICKIEEIEHIQETLLS
jgi:predicted pyridoxine 5'-phosphate oxidase superfamily flavin-nucleotide-binding protein